MTTTDFSQIKGLVFDYGGTLDTRGDHWSHIIWDAYRQEEVPVGYEAFRDAYVYGERELARTLHILPHHTFHDLMQIKMRLEMDYLVSAGLLEAETAQSKSAAVAARCYEAARRCTAEALPVLEELHKSYPMVLVSNFYGNIQTVLQDFGLDGCFDRIIESAVVGVRKPDPRIFGLGVEALGLEPQQVLVVGDSYRKDIEPALKAGCHALWIKGRGWTSQEDAVQYPYTIRCVGDVKRMLSKNC